MKKKLKNLRKSNFIHKFNLFFTNIKPIKLNNFQIIISIYAIIFSAFLVLSLPGLFNYEKYHEQIKKKIFSDFKIYIGNINKIKYRFVPFPHLLIEDAELNLSSDEKSRISQIKNLKLFISLFELYKNKNISIKKLAISRTNFYFNNDNFALFNKQLNNSIIKPIEIIDSNFFYKNKSGEVITISPIKKLDYLINFKSKEKKLDIKGKLFDTDYNFYWNKNYLNPKIINLSLFFRNPNIQITNKIEKEVEKDFNSGKLKISMLGNNTSFKYTKKQNSINFKNLKDNSSDFILNGNIELKPFDFEIDLSIKDATLNFIIENLYLKFYDFRNSIKSNFTGRLNIELQDIKNSFIENGVFEISFKNSKININKNYFIIKKIGNINIEDAIFVENNNNLLFKSKIIFKINDQDEFYRKLSIPRKNRINLNKIILKLEKEINNDNYWISNIQFNKEQNNSEDLELTKEDKHRFSNIQQLRKFIQEEFKRVTLD